MEKMTPVKFISHYDWLLYVRDNVSSQERPYILASGRMELFKSFYKVRKQAFPMEFAQKLERIQALRDPERTNDLEGLNRRIFANLTEHLFNQTQVKAVDGDAKVSRSAREQIQNLLDHLTEKNPYFALWVLYKKELGGGFVAEDWEEYLREEIGPESGDDLPFARSMTELDKLLLYFLSRDLALPRYFFERAWFLHYLREPGRMVQTRVLLNTLTEEIRECTSA